VDQSVVALLNYPTSSSHERRSQWMSQLGERPSISVRCSRRSRGRAHHNAGNLRSDDHQTVTRNDEAIEIAPANPEVIYALLRARQ
jgi:hypothetical protein